MDFEFSIGNGLIGMFNFKKLKNKKKLIYMFQEKYENQEPINGIIFFLKLILFLKIQKEQMIYQNYHQLNMLENNKHKKPV